MDLSKVCSNCSRGPEDIFLSWKKQEQLIIQHLTLSKLKGFLKTLVEVNQAIL